MIAKKILALFALYISPKGFIWTYENWFAEHYNSGDNLLEDVARIRSNFFKKISTIFVIFAVVVGYIVYEGSVKLDLAFWARVLAAFIALTGSILRATSPLGMWKQGSIQDELDNLMYIVSQVCATVILLFTLTL